MLVKGDKILVVVLIFLSLFVWVGLSNINNIDVNSFVRISVDGVLYERVPLAIDNTIAIENNSNYNVIQISNNTVRMIDSSCYNKHCLRHGSISNSISSIVCLPNRVVVEIEGVRNLNIDAIVH